MTQPLGSQDRTVNSDLLAEIDALATVFEQFGENLGTQTSTDNVVQNVAQAQISETNDSKDAAKTPQIADKITVIEPNRFQRFAQRISSAFSRGIERLKQFFGFNKRVDTTAPGQMPQPRQTAPEQTPLLDPPSQRVTELRATIQKTESNIAQLTQEISTAEEGVTPLEANLTAAQETVRNREWPVTTASLQISLLEKEATGLTEACTKANQELTKASEKFDTARNKLDAENKTIQEIFHALDTSDIETAQGILNRNAEGSLSIRGVSDKCQKLIDQKTPRSSSQPIQHRQLGVENKLKAEIAEVQNRKAEALKPLETEVAEKTAALTTLEGQLASKRAELDTARNDLEAARAPLAEAEKDLGAKRTALKSAQQDLEDKRTALESAQRDLGAQRAELEQLKQKN